MKKIGNVSMDPNIVVVAEMFPADLENAKKLALTNMLEEEIEEIAADDVLTFRPFEIKTIKVYY